jgi:hypothetical protein
VSPFLIIVSADGSTFSKEQKEVSKTSLDHTRSLASISSQTTTFNSWNGVLEQGVFLYLEILMGGIEVNSDVKEMNLGASALP